MAEVSELETSEQNNSNTNTADMAIEESEESTIVDRDGESDGDISIVEDGSESVTTDSDMTDAIDEAASVTEESEAGESETEEPVSEEPVASPPILQTVAAVEEPDPEPKRERIIGELPTTNLNRREFLTYAWGAATGLLLAESGFATYLFMYPRFKAGEFGGKFFIPESTLPSTEAPPQPEAVGKFWLVNREAEGPKAIYMVCTHLGCLYKWEPSTNRFECPCHGSKFSKEGFYIEGPAPRSLDYFAVELAEGQLVVDTGKKIVGDPAADSPAKAIVA